MANENKDSFEFYYDEVGEKELSQQLTEAYQSGVETQHLEGNYQNNQEK